MKKINLLHNDPEVIDPSDSSLRMRGSIEIDGDDCGKWEQHDNGTWTAALITGDETVLRADGKDLPISMIADHCRS
ncbi:hypothetical protein [Caballeronia sp. DA-9]|uniref:hypothetical protein n=1 Tax=Caballeronia sp. DA-9 TaxID=3436237 RepID=UPI003F667CF4